MDGTLTATQGVVNLCNACIGLGVLVKPFALAVSGWIGLTAFISAGMLITYTSILFAWSSRKILLNNDSKPIMQQKQNYDSIQIETVTPKNKSINQNKSAFQLIATGALGNIGGAFTICGFFIIGTVFLMSVCIMIWELIIDILIIFEINLLNDKILYFITIILYIMSAMILNWKQMTFVSYLGVISIAVIFVTCVGIFIHSLITYNLSPPPISELITSNEYINIHSTNIALNARLGMSEFESLLFGFVLFIFGVSGNATVPSISINLQNPRKIPIICVTSYILVSMFNIAIGSIGYWLYGEFSDVMMLNDFYIYPGGFPIVIVTVLVTLNIWASFSISLTVRCEVIDGLLGLNKKQHGYRRAVKLLYSSFIFTAAYLLRTHLSFIVAFASAINGCVGMALTIPLAIYLGAFWEEIYVLNKIFHVLLFMFCIFIGLYDGYNDIVHVF